MHQARTDDDTGGSWSNIRYTSMCPWYYCNLVQVFTIYSEPEERSTLIISRIMHTMFSTCVRTHTHIGRKTNKRANAYSILAQELIHRFLIKYTIHRLNAFAGNYRCIFTITCTCHIYHKPITELIDWYHCFTAVGN